MNAIITLQNFLGVPVLYSPAHGKLTAILDSDRSFCASVARAELAQAWYDGQCPHAWWEGLMLRSSD